MKKLLLSILLFVPLFLFGCGGGGSNSGGGGGLIGTWTGSTSSTVVVFSSPVTLFITSDDGVNIAGRVVVPNSPCFASATFAGTRSGNSIGAGMVNGPNVLGITFVLNGSTLSGNYTVTAGACIGDRGVFNVTRR